MSLYGVLRTGVSGMNAQSTKLGTIADNIANTGTIGYKAGSTQFSALLLDSSDNAYNPGAVSTQVRHAISKQGSLTYTTSTTDVAVQGNGFFAVQTPEGTRYTRVGRFQLDANGILVTSQGYPVLAGGSTVTISPDDGPVNIAEDGSISTDRATGGQQQQVIGKLDLVDFADPHALKPAPDNLFIAEGQPTAATGKIAQGMLEDSNVRPILEMTNLIEVTRNYQAMQRFLDSEHERQRRAINSITSNS